MVNQARIGRILISTASLFLLAGLLASPAGAQTPLKVVLLGDSYSAGTGADGPTYGPEGCRRRDTNWAEQDLQKLRDSGLPVETLVNRACHGALSYELFAGLTPQQWLQRDPEYAWPDWEWQTAVTPVQEIVTDKKYDRNDPALAALIKSRGYCGFNPSNQDGIRQVKVRVIDTGYDQADIPFASFECGEQLGPQIDAVDSSTDLVLLTIGGNDVRFSDIVTYLCRPQLDVRRSLV